MRILPPYDLFFVVLYALLMALAGMLIFYAAGSSETLIALPLLLALYLALALRRPLRRQRAARAPFPGEWREFLLGCSAYYRGLDEGGRSCFERDVCLFLSEVRIAGTGGAPTPWRTRLLIAAAAAAMLRGRPDWEPPLRDGITVYPGFAFDRNYQAGRGNIAGQAPAGGPLLVAEKSLGEGFADGRDGHNVIIHELAHYFDLEARKGGLRIAVAGVGESPWGEAVDRQFSSHDFVVSILPEYAMQNEAEFFACASEMFFADPRALAEAHPGLFALLKEFYGQDPRTILDRNHAC
jgi:Mlc titration factor MtfA (ptsG expression regulator)